MNRHTWKFLLEGALFVVLNLVVVRAAASAEPKRLDPNAASDTQRRLGEIGTRGIPVMRALDPEAARRQTQNTNDGNQPIVREREAVLPKPADGRGLIDETIAKQRIQQTVSVRPSADAPRRVFHRQKVTPKYL